MKAALIPAIGQRFKTIFQEIFTCSGYEGVCYIVAEEDGKWHHYDFIIELFPVPEIV